MPIIGNLGPTELIIILVIALVVLGPGKLPEVGSALGKSIKEFRKAAGDIREATSLEPAQTDAAPAAQVQVTPAAPVPAAIQQPASPVFAAPAPVSAAPAPIALAAPPQGPAPEAPAVPGPEAPAS